jgi:DNA-directed RNA polymerase I, II, and III subunit RPABC2
MSKNPEDIEDIEDIDSETSEVEDDVKRKEKTEDSEEESVTESENSESDNESDVAESDMEEEIGIKTEKNNFMTMDDLDDEDDDDDDENYLQKFEDNLNNKLIIDHHPELKIHNYDEVDSLSRIVRDENGNIVDPFHKTLPFITRYERARILGERAKQLNSGAMAMVNVEPTVIDGYLIALKEFEEKKIPFIIKRPLPNGGCEYWKFSDMEII